MSSLSEKQKQRPFLVEYWGSDRGEETVCRKFLFDKVRRGEMLGEFSRAPVLQSSSFLDRTIRMFLKFPKFWVCMGLNIKL